MTNREEGGRQKPTNEERTSHTQVKHISNRGLRGSKTLKTSGEDKNFKIKQEVCKEHTIQRENKQQIIKVRPRAAAFICNTSKTGKIPECPSKKKDLTCPFLHGSERGIMLIGSWHQPGCYVSVLRPPKHQPS